jgi:ABC-type uncharacterized transport system YnjBCD permease subunit
LAIRGPTGPRTEWPLWVVERLNWTFATAQLRLGPTQKYAFGAYQCAQIRLPLYATLAYSLSVVDMALVLAPLHPEPLSLLALRWFLASDLTRIFSAAAAATLQLLIVIAAIGVWQIAEAVIARNIRFETMDPRANW